MKHLHKLSYLDYYQILESRQEPSLVCFTNPSCGGCRRLHRLLVEHPPQIPDLQCFEILVEDAYGLVEEFDIFHLPTMFLYSNGQFHRPIHSRLEPTALENAIREALQQPAQEE